MRTAWAFFPIYPIYDLHFFLNQKLENSDQNKEKRGSKKVENVPALPNKLTIDATTSGLRKQEPPIFVIIG